MAAARPAAPSCHPAIRTGVRRPERQLGPLTGPRTLYLENAVILTGARLLCEGELEAWYRSQAMPCRRAKRSNRLAGLVIPVADQAGTAAGGCQGLPSRTIASSMISSLRIAAISATRFGFPVPKQPLTDGAQDRIMLCRHHHGHAQARAHRRASAPNGPDTPQAVTVVVERRPSGLRGQVGTPRDQLIYRRLDRTQLSRQHPQAYGAASRGYPERSRHG
jgi:hypothetical protein